MQVHTYTLYIYQTTVYESCSECSCFSAFIVPQTNLEVVHIYFDTATYDEIERDVKVSLKDGGGNVVLLC